MITSVTTAIPAAEGVKAPSRPEKAEDNAKREPLATSEIIAEKQKEAEKEPVVNRVAAAETIADALSMDFPSNASLEIAVNDQKDGFIYKAVDRDTGEVVKQYPAEEVLDRLERLAKTQGLAVDGRV